TADAQAHALGGASLAARGGTANAQASAHSDAGDANATAEATGGQTYNTGYHGGTAAASAAAISTARDATATARIPGGAAAPQSQGGRISDPLMPGGPGTDATLLDAVSGSSGGRLTLVQETTGSNSQTFGGGGGNATSTLHAQNPGLGELIAQVKAT